MCLIYIALLETCSFQHLVSRFLDLDWQEAFGDIKTINLTASFGHHLGRKLIHRNINRIYENLF
jgi:hypothetical protein